MSGTRGAQHERVSACQELELHDIGSGNPNLVIVRSLLQQLSTTERTLAEVARISPLDLEAGRLHGVVDLLHNKSRSIKVILV